MKKKIILFSVISVLLVAVAGFVIASLFWNGVILFNNPSEAEFPVRGIDVSHYQGEIDWSVIAEQNISFAFVKATEGSTYVDETFLYNFNSARQNGVPVGAYHFFSYDSSGKTQAENFIKNVIPFDGMLPPVIDIEFYGTKEEDPPSKEAVDTELAAFISAIEKHYGLKPILYATEITYDLYLADDYAEYDIWIRNVTGTPSLSDGREWTFWQYTNREKLDGYNGEEEFIDMNVFAGTADEFDKYGKQKDSSLK